MTVGQIQLPGCEAIDADGTKCELESVGVFVYHGNPHIYMKSEFTPPMRVIVWLCQQHSEGLVRWEPD